MYKIIFGHEPRIQIDTFIASYEDTFISLYVDSGITNRDIIIKNYKDLGLQFKRTILSKIEIYISPNRVFGRKINSDNSYSLIFKERSFLIIIDYTEDPKEKIRYIENIVFSKR